MSHDKEQAVKEWTEQMSKLLVGRTITAVRYLTDDELEDVGWRKKAPVITLDNGVILFPSADNEGNDAGALYTSSEECLVFPVI